MIRKLAVALLFVALGTVSALAAGFDGKWTADIAGRNGNTQTTTFEFTVAGSAVTGKITTQRGSTDIAGGKVDGNTITFTTTQQMRGNSMTATYTGTLDGDTIKFTRKMGDNPGADFVAKKAQ